MTAYDDAMELESAQDALSAELAMPDDGFHTRRRIARHSTILMKYGASAASYAQATYCSRCGAAAVRDGLGRCRGCRPVRRWRGW